ncbi:MAG TPA: crosslink repair DNA glycosylase YcaQ family protein [Solirubrobacteraceae bacterium]|nr:crosslink repair DNA glycosylase YcaQ family protein [Solirubrobacteraceae bacterium]
MSVTELSADEARRAALRAQGLLGGGAGGGRRSGVPGMLGRLGAVQLDTISVLARSHELVAYARLGAVGRDAIERAYWSGGRAFEYWAHAACVLPVEQWPLFSFRRRWFRARGQRWHQVPEGVGDRVLERLRADGPLTATELGGAKRGGPWWDWSEVKVAVEWLLDIGEVVCTTRRGFRRLYDLPERALPAAALASDVLSDAECVRGLVEVSSAALGVATVGDLAEYHRLKRAQVTAVLADTSLVEVRVAGWRERAWAHPAALAGLAARGRHRVTLLSPFDSLVWDRRRTLRMFGFEHRLEAYVPAPKRVHGYFAMPLLAGGRLVGRVDPGREGSTLVAKRVSVDPRAVDALALALAEAARWVGCERVEVRAVEPVEVVPSLRALLG